MLLCAVYAFLATKALLEFELDWDFLAYHLVGALDWFGLTTYTPEPRLVAANEGFPPLPHIVQGLLVQLTGRPSAACAVNVVGFLILVASLLHLFGRRLAWRWFLTAQLAVPLFVLHFTSGYVDLFTGAALAVAFAALLALEGDDRLARPLAAALWLAAGLGIALYSKYQAWPIAGLIGLCGSWRLASLARNGILSRRWVAVIACAIAVAGVSWPARNWIAYQNPIYPVHFPFMHDLFPNAVMESDSAGWNLPEYLHGSPRPVQFLNSALELNRLRASKYVWTLDQAAYGDTPRSPHQRMGGWFFVTVLTLVFACAVAWIVGCIPRLTALSFAGSIALVANLPQGHELRYWLFVPLSLTVFMGRSLAALPSLVRGATQALLLGAALYVLAATQPFTLDARPASAHAPPEAIEFWEARARAPADEALLVCGRLPRTIFWSGPTFNEYRVIACFGAPSITPVPPDGEAR